MKKIVCLVMAVMLCLSLVAFAESPESNDLTVVVTDSDNNPVENAVIFKTDNQDNAAALIEKLAAALEGAETPEAKAEAIANTLNTPAESLAAAIATGSDEAAGELTVPEIFDVGARGFDNMEGNVTVTLIFDMPLKAGHTVAVVIMIPDAEGNLVSQVFPGTVNEDGSITVVLPVELCQQIQAGGYQIAIVCDKASIA